MKTKLLGLLVLSWAIQGLCAPLGKPAPEFSLQGTDGKSWKLSQQKGKVVVLEWFNEGCPFVKKHYTAGNMQALQKQYTSQGVVWFTINSSAPGKQGHVSSEQLGKDLARLKASATAGLLDSTGQVGKAYEAKTTPHMFIVDAQGVLVYDGAIDDNSSSDPATIAGSKNHVKEILDGLLSGKPVKPSSTKPYGCSVKYAS